MALVIAFYPVVLVLAWRGTLGPWKLRVGPAIPRWVRMRYIYRQPWPTEPPPEGPVWPLWHVGALSYPNKPVVVG